jgi:hypothetical protein
VPNYGYTPVAGTSSPLNGIWAQEINVTAGGTLNSISIYVSVVGSITVALGLYSNQAGSPDIPLTLLVSASGSPPSGGPAWFTLPMSYVLSAGSYWMAVQASVTNALQGYYDGGQTGANIYYQTGQAWTGGLPSTYPSGNSLSNDLFSFYATVTTGGGTQTLTPTGFANAQGFGNPTLSPGPVTINPSGIPSANAFGTPTSSIGPPVISPAGIASTLLFGIPTLTGGIRIAPGLAPRQGDSLTRTIQKMNAILFGLGGP